MISGREKSTGMFSVPEKRILFFILFIVLLTRLLPAIRPEPQIYSGPYTEDGFYLFSCAEHIAHGEGFTWDGKHLTNGVQPLIVMFYVPFFLLAGMNKLLALKLSFILVALFDAISVVLIASLMKILEKNQERNKPFWFSPPLVAAILWTCLFPIYVHTSNGLETGLYSMMLLGALYYYTRLVLGRSKGKEITKIQWVALGVFLGLTVLARIDSVFLVIAIASYEVYAFRKKGFLSFILISVSAFIISSPWWWYNYTYFGNFIPQSGLSESIGVPLRSNFQDFALYMGELLSLVFVFSDSTYSTIFSYAWFLAILTGLFFLIRKYHPYAYLKKNYAVVPLLPYLLFCLSLCGIYVLFFNSSYFFPRYFQPLRILWLMAFAGCSPEIMRVLRDLYIHKKKFPAAIAIILVICAMGFSARKYWYFFSLKEGNAFYRTGIWALQHPTERIGMLQSGTAGFIAPNVVNLDGKVNFAALQAMRKRDIGPYIEAEKLDFLADWRLYTDAMARSAAKHGGRFQEWDSIGSVIILKRVTK